MTELKVSSNPHLRHRDTVQGIMLDVLIALMPATVGGIWLFGSRTLAVIAVSVASSVLAELVFEKILKKPITVGDLSAAVTGLLLALNMPSTVPLWILPIGSIVAIIVVKQFFGGLGQNFANPAITARIVLLVSFPSFMTSWVTPFDAITSATPLASDPSLFTNADLLFGRTPGCIGETSALLLLIGGLYLIARRVISPIIPASYLAMLAVMTLIFGGDPLRAVLSGGVMLGAIFMATDYATSPIMPLGKLIFGLGCGLITALIRRFGSMAEGVSFAILLMNLLVPYINKLTAPKPFGWEAKKSEK